MFSAAFSNVFLLEISDTHSHQRYYLTLTALKYFYANHRVQKFNVDPRAVRVQRHYLLQVYYVEYIDLR